MSIPCKFERSILSYDEHEVILRSHHPEIYDAGLDDLKALRQRLRDMRNKERTLARAKRREARGKGSPRGESFPGTAEHPLERKQVFAAALKRVNREVDRMQAAPAPLSASRLHSEAITTVVPQITMATATSAMANDKATVFGRLARQMPIAASAAMTRPIRLAMRAIPIGCSIPGPTLNIISPISGAVFSSPPAWIILPDPSGSRPWCRIAARDDMPSASSLAALSPATE